MSLEPLLNNKINSIIEQYSSGHITEALDTVKDLIIQNPNESLLHNIGGVCYKATGQLEMAVKFFETAIAIKSDFADAHFNLGLTLHELNQLDAAVRSYNQVLAIQTNYAKAHNNLGIIYRGLGKTDDAVMSYKQAVAIEQNYAEAHLNLGNILNELGELDDAIKSYEYALDLQPDFLEAHNNLGNIFNELGQLDLAVKCYSKAIAINLEYAEAHNNLGITLDELGEFDEAIKSYEKAITISPKYAEAHNNLGITLNRLGEFQKAINCYEQALAINSNYDEAHFNLGNTLYTYGQTDKALNSFNKALLINPDYADAHNNIGNIYQELGNQDKAFNCYIKALVIQPDNAQVHRNLSTLKQYKEGDTQFTHMQSLLSTNDLSDSGRINLCFALAKAYEDLGQIDNLFTVLNEGNKLRKQELNYSISKDLSNHSLFRKIFMSSFKIMPNYEPLAINPIFIVGMPRSGTSLVEQIISSHHKVHGAGELSALDNLIVPIMNNYLSNNGALSEKTILSVRLKYINLLSNLNVSEKFITDKTPTNFENIGFILKAFPEAKIIHLKRDAMAVCWSNYQRYFDTDAIGFQYDMEDLARFYISYSELMNFWHEQFPSQIYDINYEFLTTNQEEETRKLLAYCELEWDENCLNFHKNKRTVKTASSLQVKEKIYQGSSEAWKKYESHLKPLTHALGYYQEKL
jgi:tetratricopeptide (TPR) repeat protein